MHVLQLIGESLLQVPGAREIMQALCRACDDGAVCALSGAFIAPGEPAVPRAALFSDRFTNWDALAAPNSEWVSVPAAVCLTPVLPNEKGDRSPLRYYHFLAVEGEPIRLLRQDELEDALTGPQPGKPYVLGVSYSRKKHICLYAKVTYPQSSTIHVATDAGSVGFFTSVDGESSYARLKAIEIARRRYCVVRGKEGGATPATYFTKDNILRGGELDVRRIQTYEELTGADYESEERVLDMIRQWPGWELFIFTLKRRTHAEL